MHFYATESNDVLIRTSLVDIVSEALKNGASDSVLTDQIDDLLKNMPSLTGAKYSVWSNVKCPKCRLEFPYRFTGNLKVRLSDQEVVLIDGCTVDSDEGIFLIEVSVPS